MTQIQEPWWPDQPPPPIPRWARLLAKDRRGRCAFDILIDLGFWDMRDGDWYVNGHWNWRCWETYDKHHARLVAAGWRAPLYMPRFPRMMKRLFV